MDKEFYRRIENAFKHLEMEVKRGRIQYYGISSNTLATELSHDENVSLEFLFHVAKNVSENHHFKGFISLLILTFSLLTSVHVHNNTITCHSPL
jgi:hypothetical protein